MVVASRYMRLASLVALLAGCSGALAQDTEGGLVTLSVKDAPLLEVANLISEMSGVTIVPHRDVQTELITITLKDKPLQSALQVIAQAYDLDLTLMADTGTYLIRRQGGKSDGGRVVQFGTGAVAGSQAVPVRPEVVLPPAAKPATQPTTTRVETRPATRQPHLSTPPPATGGSARMQRARIDVRYAKPSDIASYFGCPSLDVSPTGRHERYYQGANVPYQLTELGDTINRHDGYIKQAKRERWQINPQALVNNAVYGRDQFGDDAGGGAGGGPGAGGGAGGRAGGGGGAVFELPEGIEELVGYDLISALIVRGEPEAIAALRELVELIDVAPQQIAVEARFVTLSANDADSFGVVWTLTDGTNTISGSTPGQGGASIAFQTATGNFQALITAITRNNRGKVVNAPVVATQNGQPAVVAFQQTVPVTISDTVVTDASQTVSTTIETIPVTTALVVVPRVTGAPPDESITTIISPQVADIIGFVDNPSGGTIPIVATQTISTLLRVRNGETIALGGLIRKNNSESSTKIPFLGDLPFIGQLFRSRTRNTDESELMIFLTPTIIRELRLGGGPAAVR